LGVKVYVETGDLKVVVQREHYPKTTKELVSVVKEAVESYPRDTIELGDLMRISRKRSTPSDDDYWIASKSALEKAGFKVEKRKGVS